LDSRSARTVTCVSLLATLPIAALAGDDVKISSTISFSSDAVIRESVKEQCKFQTDVPKYIDKYSDQVELVDGPLQTNARVLTISIIDARAAGGGYFSGGKWLTVEGVLTEDGRKLGNFKAKRFTLGVFNLTACGAAHRCSKAVGKDIAEWLEDPQLDSMLGTL
jgi:hypothetical protein